MTTADPAGHGVAQVYALLAAGRAFDARRLADTQVGAHPGDPSVLVAAAQAHEGTGDLAGACALLGSALAAAPERPHTLQVASIVYLQARRFDEALDLGRRLVALDPANGEAQAHLAALMYDAQGWYGRRMVKQARPIALEAVRLAPTSAHAHHVLGLIELNLGRRADARHHFDQALALDPQHADLHLTRSYATGIGRDGRAARAEAVDAATALAPNAERVQREQRYAALRRLRGGPAGLLLLAGVDALVSATTSEPGWEATSKLLGTALPLVAVAVAAWRAARHQRVALPRPGDGLRPWLLAIAGWACGAAGAVLVATTIGLHPADHPQVADVDLAASACLFAGSMLLAHIDWMADDLRAIAPAPRRPKRVRGALRDWFGWLDPATMAPRPPGLALRRAGWALAIGLGIWIVVAQIREIIAGSP